MRETPGPSAGDIDLATVLHALSDPIRLELVAGLARRGESVCGAIIGDRVAKSTRSHHLRVLRESGLVATRYVGTVKYARLRSEDLEARFPGLLAAVVAAVVPTSPDPAPGTCPRTATAAVADEEGGAGGR